MKLSETEPGTSEVAIFGRLIKAEKGDLPRSLARYILQLGFDEADQSRMRELAARNQEDELSVPEKRELFSFVKAGHLLALLHAKGAEIAEKTQSLLRPLEWTSRWPNKSGDVLGTVVSIA